MQCMLIVTVSNKRNHKSIWLKSAKYTLHINSANRTKSKHVQLLTCIAIGGILAFESINSSAAHSVRVQLMQSQKSIRNFMKLKYYKFHQMCVRKHHADALTLTQRTENCIFRIRATLYVCIIF